MPRGTAQIDDISTWLPPSLHTPWRNVFFEYIKQRVEYILDNQPYMFLLWNQYNIYPIFVNCQSANQPGFLGI